MVSFPRITAGRFGKVSIDKGLFGRVVLPRLNSFHDPVY